jgi:hypothetical protein
MLPPHGRQPPGLTRSMQRRLHLLYLILLGWNVLAGGLLLTSPPAPLTRLLLLALLSVSLLAWVAAVLVGGWTLLARHSARSALATRLVWLCVSGVYFFFAYGALLAAGWERQLIARLGIADDGGSSVYILLAVIAFAGGSIFTAFGITEGIRTVRRIS